MFLANVTAPFDRLECYYEQIGVALTRIPRRWLRGMRGFVLGDAPAPRLKPNSGTLCQNGLVSGHCRQPALPQPKARWLDSQGTRLPASADLYAGAHRDIHAPFAIA